MKTSCSIVLLLVAAAGARAAAQPDSTEPRDVRFATADGGMIFAHRYGSGEYAVVLAHGAVFNKESWRPLALRLVESGHQVLAIDFRGYGSSLAGRAGSALHEDVLAAVRYLRNDGAKTVAVVGGSMGGGAAATAAVAAKEGEIDRLVLLSPMPIANPQKIHAGSTLVVASQGEELAATVGTTYGRVPGEKRIELLGGTAHAQHIFNTPQAERLTKLILMFLAVDESKSVK